MNYIELINNTWALREQGILSVHEADLYLYLVHKSNRLGWKNPFNQSTEIICAVLGVSRNALTNRRNRLQQIGLIKFKEGVAKKRPATYELCILKDTLPDTLGDTLPDTLGDTLPDTYTLNKTKLNKTISEREVDYQFVISEFNKTCKTLPKVDKLTEQRKQKLDYIAQNMGIEKLIECFKLADSSQFLSKRKGKWRATFDWIIEPENMVKILEGSYSYESKDSTPSTSKHCDKQEAKQYGADKWAAAAARLTGDSA